MSNGFMVSFKSLEILLCELRLSIWYNPVMGDKGNDLVLVLNPEAVISPLLLEADGGVKEEVSAG